MFFNEDRRKRSFLDPVAAARLASLPLLSRRPMQGNVSGRHQSPHRGASVEFAEYRKYVPGDDPRRMDWRAFGRTERYYVKEFEADTNLRCCLIVDISGSMGYGAEAGTKLEYARRLAATLSYLAIQQGDAVGLYCVGERLVRVLPPRRNPAHLSLLFNQLEEVVPQGTSGLIAALHELAETIRQRALVILISDLFMEPNELRSCFEHLRFCKHDVAIFHLLDAQEIEFNFQRPTRFIDLEGGTPIFAEPNEIVDRYRRAVDQYLEGMRKITLETAVDYQRVLLHQSYEQVLTEFLVRRTRSRRG
jgi:uncharacterized protein (DUF58 family)